MTDAIRRGYDRHMSPESSATSHESHSGRIPAYAAERKLRATAARAALAEYEAEFGTISEAEVARVRREWHL